MIENPERWEGQVVNGKFPLGRALGGGSERSAVFLVEKGEGVPAQAVIRFVDADAEGAKDQLRYWEVAVKLNHPNLIKLFETGRCQIGGHDLFYVLSEYAEENLAQIVPERALTTEEARQVLGDVLSALSYIHGQGLVHGRMKPSNIFAIGDKVKISSDTLCPVGKALSAGTSNSAYDAPEFSAGILAPSADAWSLGVILAEAMTKHLPLINWQRRQAMLPQGIPQPFQEIVENCLQVDPVQRWSVAQISDRLGGVKSAVVRGGAVAGTTAPQRATEASSTAAAGPSSKWPYAIVVAAAVILAIVFLARSKPHSSEPAQPASDSSTAISKTVPSVAPSTASSNSADQSCCDGRVTERVPPRVSPGAQRTIQGRIRVQVEVNVDDQGNVTEARLKSAGPSRYFAERALEAAKGWKFKPPVKNGRAVESTWLVKFAIGRGAIDDSAQQIKP